MNADIVDGIVFQFCDNNRKQGMPYKKRPVSCNGAAKADKHTKQAIHICHAKKLRQRLTRLSRPIQVGFEASLDGKNTNMEPGLPTPASDVDFSFEADESFMEVDTCDTPIADVQAGVPLPAAPVPDDGDSNLRLSELLTGIIGHRTFELNRKCPDLFAELQTSLAMGEIPFSTPLSRSSANEEHQLFDDTEPDFGVELPDVIHDKATTIFNTVSADNPTYPWPSKADFITSLLFSSPHLPFSDLQKKAVLNWAKELGAPHVPSLGAVKKCHNYLDELVGNPTQKTVSRAGNVFYINNIAATIAKDYANPLTRFAMRDYPEDSGEGMSQVFHGQKLLLDLPSPPAARVDGTIYFTDELLQDTSGDYFIPERFFYASPPADLDGGDAEPHEHSDTKPLYALGQAVERTEAGFIINEEQEIIPTSAFMWSFEDIAVTQGELNCGLTASSVKYASLSPNLLRAKANGRMVYTVPLIIFMDDVSGNISKQWNKHHAIYMSNANLPREMLEKEFFVRFVTSSPHAAPMELMHAMKQSISDAAACGVAAWDCKHNEEVLLILRGLFIAGDNPMQAEECSHAGLNCNYLCRTCDVGGTKEYKASLDGYSSLFMSGNLRTPEGTTATIRQQFEAALKPGATEKIKYLVSTTGVRDTASVSIINAIVELGKKLRKRAAGTQAMPEAEVIASLEKEFEDLLRGDTLEGTLNPLLGMDGLDMHMDTPTEILHTMLLGVVKYFWGQTVFLLEKAKLMDVFQIRLESVDTDRLNAPSLNAEYICHYKGGLIGKHFKSLSQVMPFVIYDLVPSTVLDAWTLIGELIVLIWHTKIINTEAYLASLSRTIEDFLNVTAQCSPSIIIITVKLRVMTAAKYSLIKTSLNMSRLVGFGTTPRSRNGFREVKRFSDTYTITQNRRDYLGCHILFIALQYLVPERLNLLNDAVAWNSTRCARILKTMPQPGIVYFHAKSVVASEGDVMCLKSHVVFRQATNGQMGIGRIREILISSDDPTNVSHIALQLFAFEDTLHPAVHLPCLNLLDHEVVVTAADIKCMINLQHNCVDSKCADTLQWTVRQEQVKTSQTKPIIRHKSTLSYFVNTYSIHNYDHIHLVIPETLRKTPLRVTNVAEVRATAVQHMKEKKASKKSGEVSQEGERTGNDSIPGPSIPTPAFDNPPAKSKTAAKSKAKASTGPSTRGRKPASSRAAQAIAGPTGLETMPTQQNPVVQSAASLDQQGQGQFVPPTGFYPPPMQSFHPSLPHSHHLLQPRFPPPQQYLPPPQQYLPPPQQHLPPPQQYLPPPQQHLPPPQQYLHPHYYLRPLAPGPAPYIHSAYHQSADMCPAHAQSAPSASGSNILMAPPCELQFQSLPNPYFQLPGYGER